MWEFPNDLIYIPLAEWVDAFVKWLTVAGADFFGSISDALLVVLVRADRFLLWLPWFVVVLVVVLAAWKVVGWRLSVGVALSLTLIGAFGLWDAAMSTLALVIVATVLATIIGIPVGIAMARSRALENGIKPILDLMQTMPSFVYLIPALMLFGLGKVPALIATLIYAVPPVIRLTNLGIRQVATDVVEAAQAFGATSSQVLFWVQVPLAMPTIMAGINQTIMMAVAMVVIASMIGAGGLGKVVLEAISRLKVGMGFTAGISIVILAIIIDRITSGAAGRGRTTPLP